MTAIAFRAPTQGDAPRVLDLLIERDIVDLGYPDCALEDDYDDWSRVGFDLTADARVAISPEGRIVGYAVIRAPGTYALVAPDHEGRGIGIRLLTWSEARDRELRRQRHRQGIAAGNTRATRLLLQTGYRFERSYFRLARELDQVADTIAAPNAVELRPLHVDRDAPLVHTLHAASFNRNSDYRQQSLAEFRAEHLDVHDLDPRLSCIAEDGTATVGFLLMRRWQEDGVGYIDLLGVHPGHRRCGLATAMLQTAFTLSAAARLRAVQLGVALRQPRRAPALQAVRNDAAIPNRRIHATSRGTSACAVKNAGRRDPPLGADHRDACGSACAKPRFGCHVPRDRFRRCIDGFALPPVPGLTAAAQGVCERTEPSAMTGVGLS